MPELSVSDEELLIELFLNWESSQHTPDPKTPEAVCSSRPDLLPALKQRIEELASIDRQLLHSIIRAAKKETVPAGQSLTVTVPVIPGFSDLVEIGRGGMGVVYRARQESLNRTVAIKTVHKGGKFSSRHVELLRREAELLARIQHPGVVRIYQIQEIEGDVSLILEFVDGTSLSKMTHESTMQPTRAAEIARDIAATLAAVHAKGILHRDIKSGNVLVDVEGRVKVTDFGIAKVFNSDLQNTLTGEVLGTPNYMAPEQTLGKSTELTQAVDVYAIGATLYNLLTGRPPFVGDTPLAIFRQVQESEPIAPTILASRLPRDLETICLKCLRKDPHQRYASAMDLSADLQNFLDGKAIAARPPGAFELIRKWARLHPDRAALIMSLAVAIGLLIGIGSWAMARITGVQRESKLQAELMSTSLTAATDKGRVQEFYVKLARIVDRGVHRRIGWSWQNLDELKDVSAECPPNAPDALLHLRSEATKAMMAFDIRKQREILKGFEAYSMEFSSDGAHLVVGANHDQNGLVEIKVIDPTTWETQQTIQFEAAREWVKTRPDGVRSMAFSPDLSKLYVGTRSGLIHVFETRNWTLVRTWQAHDHYVHRIRFSLDGTQICTCSEDKSVKLWYPDGRLIKRHDGLLPYTDLAILNDPMNPHLERIVATSNFPAILSASKLEQEQTSTTHADYTMFSGRCVAALPNGGGWIRDSGMMFVVASSGYDRTLNLIVDPRDNSASLGELHSVDVSPNGRWFLSSSSQYVKLWDLSGREKVAELSTTGRGRIVGRFHPDGKFLALTGASKTSIYELSHNTRDEIWEERLRQSYRLSQMDLSRDGNHIVASRRVDFEADRHPEIQILSEPIHDSLLTKRLSHPGTLSSFIQFSPDNQTIACNLNLKNDEILFCHANSWKTDKIKHFRSRGTDEEFRNSDCGRFSPDGCYLYMAAITATHDPRNQTPRSGEIRVIEVDSLKSRSLWVNLESELALRESQILSLAVGQDLLVFTSNDKTIRVLNRHEGTVVKKLPLASVSDCVSMTVDESSVIAGTRDGKLMVIDLPSAEIRCTVQAHDDQILAVTHVGPGVYASGARNHELKLWKRQGSELVELLSVDSLSGAVAGLDASDDGRVLAVHIREETAVRLLRIDLLRAHLREYGLDW